MCVSLKILLLCNLNIRREMKTIKVKNTRNIDVGGKPGDSLAQKTQLTSVAVSPSLYSHIRPKLLVKVGDSVKIGTPLFFDKQDERLVFVSPQSGAIGDIIYGERRTIKHIVVEVKGEEYEAGNALTESDLSSSTVDSLKETIIKQGLWSSFRQFPFLNIPKTSVELPSSIYISLDEDEPHYPKASLFLKGNEEYFNFGVQALKKLFKNVNIAASKEDTLNLDLDLTHRLKGYYPANNEGAFLYANKQDASENQAFTIKPQKVIQLGYMLKTGKYLNTKIITVAGSELNNPTHMQVSEGISLSDIFADETIKDTHRVIAGGIFRGRKAAMDEYLGGDDDSVHILSEDIKQDLFGFFKLGFNKPTLSRVYAYALSPKKDLELDTSLYGEDRSCISCGICPDVCPVGMHPQEVMKNLADNRTSEAMDLGLLDCTLCGLCTYACPSKVELNDIFKQAKDGLYKELNA